MNEFTLKYRYLISKKSMENLWNDSEEKSEITLHLVPDNGFVGKATHNSLATIAYNCFQYDVVFYCRGSFFI